MFVPFASYYPDRIHVDRSSFEICTSLPISKIGFHRYYIIPILNKQNEYGYLYKMHVRHDYSQYCQNNTFQNYYGA